VAVSAVDHKPKRSTDLQRLRNLAANGAAALLVHHDDPDWSRLWWVRADGPASVVEDPERRAEALAALAAKYDQYRDRPPAGPVIALTVERLVGWAAIPGP
jgi:PPOX class probable F420-dependent enzyme